MIPVKMISKWQLPELSSVLECIGNGLLFALFLIVTLPSAVENLDCNWKFIPSSEFFSVSKPNPLFLHLLFFATHFGTQMWMTWVSGIVLYFKLPKHIFGQVQTHLFPAYFWFTNFLNAGTLLFWPMGVTSRWAICLCFVAEMICHTVFVPVMKSSWAKKRKLENEAIKQTGDEKEEAKSEAISLKKFFRKLHMMCAAVNLIALAMNLVHIYALATAFAQKLV